MRTNNAAAGPSSTLSGARASAPSASSSSRNTTSRSAIPHNPYLDAYRKQQEEYSREKNRAEDIGNWPFHIPREIMDLILADPTLGVREHLALASTCPALRRIYHNNDVFNNVRLYRTLPINGQPRIPYSGRHPETLIVGQFPNERLIHNDRSLSHLATKPQKKKANGPFMKKLVEMYAAHNAARQAAWEHVSLMVLWTHVIRANAPHYSA